MLLHYLSIAGRNLNRNRVSAAAGILGLALGLACFLGAYLFKSYVDGADRQFPHSDRIYAIYQRTHVPALNLSAPLSPDGSPLLAEQLRKDFPGLEVARSKVEAKALVTVGNRPSFRRVAYVEPEFLSIFELPFVAGSPQRALQARRAALLTEAASTALFGRTDVVGRTIHLKRIGDVEVAGVVALPEPSEFGRSVSADPAVEIFLVTTVPEDIARFPPGFEAANLDPSVARNIGWLGFLGYVHTYVLFPADRSITPAMLEAAWPAFVARHVRIDREQGEVGFAARPVSRVYGDGLDDILWGAYGLSLTDLLLLLGAIVLATACLNFVNLTTARSLVRAKEVGLRKVLGARRRQVAVQYVCEGVLATALAMPIALIALQAAAGALRAATGLRLAAPWSAGLGFWAFVLALTLAVGAATAAYPALALGRVAPIAALRAGAVRAGPRWLRAVLIGLQFAAASFLLIAVMVVAAQNAELERSAAGLGRDPLVVIAARLKDAGVDADEFSARLKASPYIEAVTGASVPPWEMSASGTGYAPTPDDPSKIRLTQNQKVSYGYFSVLGTKVLAGRTFSAERGDDASGEQRAPQRIVLDRLAARQFGWSDPREAVGKTLYDTSAVLFGGKPNPLSIIGVVEHAPPRIMGVISRAFVYSLDPDGISFPIVAVSREHVRAALAHIDAVWADLAPDYPLTRQLADRRFAAAYGLFHSLSVGFMALASFAFVIAVTGLVGMIVFVAGRRRHEMGVRKVLGAHARGLFGLMLRDYLTPVVVANLAVWPLALIAARVYVNLFLHPAPLGPLPFLSSLAITLAIALAVVARHALIAARVEPAGVLRYE